MNLFKGQLYNCIDADSGERLDPYYLLPPGQTLERGMCEAGSITVNSSVYTAARNISLMPYNITTRCVCGRARKGRKHAGSVCMCVRVYADKR